MRLLTRTNGELAFVERSNEPYAILSHTWGKEEVTYEDVCYQRFNDGFRKIDFTLQQAAADGFQHVWVDTCCIDKRDRTELGEAINLMWKWYQEAAVCYVYMADVPEVAFTKSRWFERGWTLQELLAPNVVRFYSREGTFLGTKRELHQDIFLACGVDTRLDPFEVPVAERFRWSLTRQTMKEEDTSYCLLGLLEVSLIFNYGEGIYARKRLLKAIKKEHGSRALREIEDHSTTEIEEFTPAAFMQTLVFKSMNFRRDTIGEQYPATCEWLLEHPVYQRWLRQEIRLIWLKGGPGIGKSTLMKFVESQSDGISFYFNARGEILEQTTLGMYRSLLWQILRRHRSIEQRVFDRVKRQNEIGRWSMTVQTLQSCLRYAVSLLEEPVRCWVDALDECDTKEVQEMVYFFEDTSGLQVCFASRYYPAIAIQSDEVLLEKQQHDDLRQYVYGRLRTRDILLKEQVISKANGNFFWAVLVVRLISEDLINGNMYQIEQRLKDLPSEVRTLLRSIAMSSDELPRFRFCIQWILFARKPLTIREFYHAMVTTLCEAGLAPQSAYDAPFNINAESLARFLVNCSRGLAEVPQQQNPIDMTMYVEPRVQFIHESVRDYFLGGGLQDFNTETPDPESQAHEDMKLACQRYVSMIAPRVANLSNWNELDDQLLQATHHNDCLWTHYPFSSYASTSVLYHADKAAPHFSQEAFLRNFDFRVAGKLSVLWMPNHMTAIDLWPALVGQDCNRLFRLACELNLPNEDKTYVPFLDAVSMWKIEMLQILFEIESPQSLFERYGNTALYLCIYTRQIGLIRGFIKLGIDLNGPLIPPDNPRFPISVGGGEDTSPLHASIIMNAFDIAILLIQNGADLRSTDWGGLGPLHYSAIYGSVEVIEALIAGGSDVEARDMIGKTTLHYAAAYGHFKAIIALINHGADKEVRDDCGITPLHESVIYHQDNALRLLLELGCNVEAENDRGETALHIARQQYGRSGRRAPLIMLEAKVTPEDKSEHIGKANG